MQIVLGCSVVIFTIYRMISYRKHQGWHIRVSGDAKLAVTDVITSRMFEVLYALIFAAAAYGVFVGGSSLLSIVIGFACMVMSWGVRQAALKDLGKNYGHEIVVLKRHELVQSGMYNFLRHPLYLGLCMDTFGAALMAQNMYGWVLWIAFVFFVIRRIHREDMVLREVFGDQAVRYQERVPSLSFWLRMREIYKR